MKPKTFLIVKILGVFFSLAGLGLLYIRPIRASGITSPQSYPPNPTANIPWSGGTSGVADIQAAFNNARSIENTQLGISIPALTMPSQLTWDAMSENDKVLWLINRERIDRGVHPLHGWESNVIDVAQDYAQYLLDNNATGHEADGHTPWERLDLNPTINSCHDFLNVAENLAYFWTSAPSNTLPLEHSIYIWMYEGTASSWGHRHMLLWYPFNDNSGPNGQEGFLGVGHVTGGPHNGWPVVDIIVLNAFDPCATWAYLDTSRLYLPLITR